MKIVEFLGPELFLPSLAGRDQRAVLDELAAHLVAKVPGLDKGQVDKVLLDQLAAGPAVRSEEVVILGGNLASLTTEVACFGRSAAGVDFGATDGEPTHLFFVSLGPEHSGTHLLAIARMSRILKDAGIRTQMKAALDALAMHDALAAYEARY